MRNLLFLYPHDNGYPRGVAFRYTVACTKERGGLMESIRIHSLDSLGLLSREGASRLCEILDREQEEKERKKRLRMTFQSPKIK